MVNPIAAQTAKTAGGQLVYAKQEAALVWARDAGLVVEPLSGSESDQIALSLDRLLRASFAERNIIQMFERHLLEIIAGANVAKDQMDAEISGEQPRPGKICGPVPIRAAYFGLGDDWTDLVGITAANVGYFTPGAPADWIHSGTTILGGTAGLPIRVGSNVVHVILGIQDLHPSPKLESVKFEINAREEAVLNLEYTHQDPLSRHLKELEKAYLWKQNDTVLGEIMISSAFGATIEQAIAFPALIGVSYIMEPEARVHDPPNLDGTVHNVVMSTG